MNTIHSLLILMFCLHKGMTELALRFQKDSAPTINSTAVKTMDPSLYDTENITSFSLSLWVKVDYFRTQTFLFSYAISDRKSNQMSIGLGPNHAKVTMGENQNGPRRRNYNPDEWYHLAAVFEEGSFSQFYVNGELDHEGNDTINVMHLNGTFVLGQEQDAYIGGFQAFQSFSGWISHFNIYNRTLKSKEIEVLSNCTTAVDIPGTILPWNIKDWELNGAVEEEEVDLCGKDRLPFTMIAEPLTRENSRSMCTKAFRSQMYVPQTEEENELMYNVTVPFAETCKSPFHRTAYAWLGGCSSKKGGNVTDLEGRNLNWTNLDRDRSSQGCLALQEGAYAKEWTKVGNGRRYKLCPVCTSASEQPLTMRGLCEDEDVHAMFFPMRKIQDKLSFKGFTRFNVVYDKQNRTWFLNDIWSNETLAKHFAPDGSYPLGTKEWEVVEDYGLCNLPAGEKKKLSFANCKKGEFNCDDGSCIPMDKRCDLLSDCFDGSDEDHCDRLIKPEHYLPDLLAPGTNGEPLNVKLFVTVTRIFDVDVRSMTVLLDAIVSVAWFDRRLSYQNLKNISEYNVIPAGDIWTPELEYLDIFSKKFHSSSPSVLVNKLGIPARDDLSRVKSDELFYGDENHLSISWKVNVPLNCDMYLDSFPFDEQICEFKLKIKNSRPDLIKWEETMPEYTGSIRLAEYEVGQLWSSVTPDTHRHSIATISIPLSRRYSYYITTTFVPTYMLVIVSYMSFFCKAEYVDLRVMMTITTLLVMYSLYQQIEDSLPKTAYTKAIDYWFFFCLIIIMTQIIFHVILDLNYRGAIRRLRKGTNASSSTETLGEVEDKKTAKLKRNMLRAGRVAYGIIQILFAVIYIIVFRYDLTARTIIAN